MAQWLETHLLNEERDKRNPSWRADAANKLWNTEGMSAPTGEQWRKWVTGIPEVLGEMGKSYLGGMANIADAQNPALMTPVELPNLSQGMVDMATEAAKTFHPDDPRAPLSSLAKTVGPWTEGGAINFLPWLPKGVNLIKNPWAPKAYYRDFPLLKRNDLSALSPDYTYYVHGTSDGVIPKIHKTGFNITQNTSLAQSAPFAEANMIRSPTGRYPHNNADAGILFRETDPSIIQRGSGSHLMERIGPDGNMRVPPENVVGYLSKGDNPLVKSSPFDANKANSVVVPPPVDTWLPTHPLYQVKKDAQVAGQRPTESWQTGLAEWQAGKNWLQLEGQAGKLGVPKRTNIPEWLDRYREKTHKNIDWDPRSALDEWNTPHNRGAGYDGGQHGGYAKGQMTQQRAQPLHTLKGAELAEAMKSIEVPVQGMVKQILDDGGRTISSNYHGPYRKGVYYQREGTFKPNDPLPESGSTAWKKTVKFKRHADDPDFHPTHTLRDPAIDLMPDPPSSITIVP